MATQNPNKLKLFARTRHFCHVRNKYHRECMFSSFISINNLVLKTRGILAITICTTSHHISNSPRNVSNTVGVYAFEACTNICTCGTLGTV
uniref:Uncharacterized protein n=1 Tax=Arundo donax TaxID=35708 RepID=A0A0A9ADF8_ARUDO